MATEEWIKRAILNGKQYEDLPARVRQVFPVGEYRQKVKEHCIQRGLAWEGTLAATACSEQEYYEDLLAFYRQTYRLFPYHLAEHVCRDLRVSPFRYYTDLLCSALREEQSYDQIPNFTAADVVKVVGIGRNEYIATLNKCKAKKLLWRVNRAIARELLPAEPLPLAKFDWWIAHVVNLGETEFRALTPAELRVCSAAAQAGGARVGDFAGEPGVVDELHRRGLLYFDVPIRPDDHVSIPPLEGFVSNRDSAGGAERGDPVEAVLYAAFVATSARASVAELADMLQVDLSELRAAISIACRLGFASRLPNPRDSDAGPGSATTAAAAAADTFDLGPDDGSSPSAAAQGAPALRDLGGAALGEGDGDGSGQGIALVVDAQVTSYLMMGALSPGLKRHAVTLFEGGRVAGAEVVAELVRELEASAEAAAGFEGEMRELGRTAQALAAALRCVRSAAGGRPVELLRKESLAGLPPAAAARVLSHAYAAVVPVAPLPYPPLPLAPGRPGPTNFGPTAEAATPWLALALYMALRAGPPGVVLVAGQRLWRLPPQLAACTHALLWPWDLDALRAQEAPVPVEAGFLLYTLNDVLSRTALLVQPLTLAPGDDFSDVPCLDIALPLSTQDGRLVEAVDSHSGDVVKIAPPPVLSKALAELGLDRALGSLRLLQLDPPQEATAPGDTAAVLARAAAAPAWTPLQARLGMPLQPLGLCTAVCAQAQAAGFLGAEARRAHAEGQAGLQRHLCQLVAEFGACSNCLGGPPGAPERGEASAAAVDLPLHNLLFDGRALWRLDYSEYTQGVGALCLD
ncbi:hypothetical protein WJX81_007135 [Elliptochloris bilobata]|uniref:Protein FAM91A1 n=1 Tax=Elliptochloris bilobata TaxID=381761 RepID=A0AAW1RRJ9_9CHLO